LQNQQPQKNTLAQLKNAQAKAAAYQERFTLTAPALLTSVGGVPIVKRLNLRVRRRQAVCQTVPYAAGTLNAVVIFAARKIE
jgi:hypothetical protein